MGCANVPPGKLLERCTSTVWIAVLCFFAASFLGSCAGSVTQNNSHAPSGPASPPTLSLSVSPLTLSFNGISGSSNPPTQSVNVSNSGGGILTWTASARQPWIKLSSSSGTGGQTTMLGATLTGLAAGTYSGTVSFSAAGATPSVQTVQLTLVVTASTPPPTPSPTGGGGQHYAAPNGTPFGDGSSSHPWDLQTALNQPSSVVQPGDAIWLRNGVYGNGGTIFQSNLNGTSTQLITVRQYVGERATVNGGLQVNGTYTRYWGFEVTNMGIVNRNSNTSGQSPPPNFPSGFSIFGSGNQFINLIVHDAAEGFGFWTAAQGGEIYGSVIYNNGWQGLDRGHGQGLSTHNQSGV